jgi:MOSC domain-containing protein YiiM
MNAQRGKVDAIFLAPAHEAPPREVAEAVARPGRGLEGDRHYDDPDACDITLVETEAIETLRSEHGVDLGPGESRRQVQVRGVKLADFIGRRFRIGDVECEGEEHCEPCKHLAGVVDMQVILKGLVHTGLRAGIIKGGTIRTGDPVELSTA